jgi:hypothetical protein
MSSSIERIVLKYFPVGSFSIKEMKPGGVIAFQDGGQLSILVRALRSSFPSRYFELVGDRNIFFGFKNVRLASETDPEEEMLKTLAEEVDANLPKVPTPPPKLKQLLKRSDFGKGDIVGQLLKEKEALKKIPKLKDLTKGFLELDTEGRREFFKVFWESFTSVSVFVESLSPFQGSTAPAPEVQRKFAWLLGDLAQLGLLSLFLYFLWASGVHHLGQAILFNLTRFIFFRAIPSIFYTTFLLLPLIALYRTYGGSESTKELLRGALKKLGVGVKAFGLAVFKTIGNIKKSVVSRFLNLYYALVGNKKAYAQ